MERHLSQVRILSIDGGGVRGIIPAYWLQQLEDEIQKTHTQDRSIKNTFDWFVGTSAGAIVAAGLVFDKSPSDIVNLFHEKARVIFPTFWRGRFLNPLRWSGFIWPKHSGSGLTTVLKETFGTKKFKDVDKNKRLIVVSYNAGTRRPIIFDSANERFAETLIWQACRASAAAPTFLPEAEFLLDGVEPTAFLDGGIVANDPAAVAVADLFAARLDRESTLVVSLGTGESGKGFNPGRFWKLSGSLTWIPSITTTLMEASDGAFESIIKKSLDEQHYFRFDTPLSLARTELDDSSPKQLLALLHDAAQLWTSDSVQKRRKMLVPLLTAGSLVDLSALKGTWTSTFTWGPANQLVTDVHKVEITVLKSAFLSGRTCPGANYPGRFEASAIGNNLVGNWYNEQATLGSTFVLHRDSDVLLTGRWIGAGDNAAPLYEGSWVLEKLP